MDEQERKQRQLDEIFEALRTDVRGLTFQEDPARESRGISMYIAFDVPKGMRIELNRLELRAWARQMIEYADQLDAEE